MNKKTIVLCAVVTFSSIGNANAGGLLADVYGAVTGDHRGAEMMDGAHDRIKKAIPAYGKAEEQVTNDFRESIGLERHCEPLYNKWGEEIDCR